MAVQGRQLSFHLMKRSWLARAARIVLWVLVLTSLASSEVWTMPVSVDPPQFSTHGSPSGSKIALRGSPHPHSWPGSGARTEPRPESSRRAYGRDPGQAKLDVLRPTDSGQIKATLPQLPLSFIANVGQTDPAVGFHVKGAGHTIFFTTKEVVFSAAQQLSENDEDERATSVVQLRFAGASPTPTLEGLEQLPGVANFFLGNDPTKWRTNVPNYGAVIYRELYPGIDLVYRGTEGNLKSEFLVAPGGDPSVIRQVYSGVEAQRLREDGALVLQTVLGELVEEAPAVYQEIDGQRVEVEGSYRLLEGGQVGLCWERMMRRTSW